MPRLASRQTKRIGTNASRIAKGARRERGKTSEDATMRERDHYFRAPRSRRTADKLS